MSGIESYLQTLQRRDEVPPDEVALLRSLPMRRASYAAGQEIVTEGSRPRESCLVTEGFAARVQVLEQGQRQVSALHVAGDFVDLHSLLLKEMDHSVVALGRCEVGFVPHEAITAATRKSHHLGRLFWLSTLIDAAIQRAWIVCFGRRRAEQHLAHLLCELYLRLEIVGRAWENRFAFPVTQAVLADVLGLSTVHVNRVIQELRAQGLVSWERGTVTILDFERLARLAEYNPTYLSLRVEPR